MDDELQKRLKQFKAEEVRHDHMRYLLYCDFHILFLYVRAESLM